MSDYFWLCVAAVLCIILAYLWGLQYGYKRGVADGKYKAIMQYIEMKAKLTKVYKEGETHADIQ